MKKTQKGSRSGSRPGNRSGILLAASSRSNVARHRSCHAPSFQAAHGGSLQKPEIIEMKEEPDGKTGGVELGVSHSLNSRFPAKTAVDSTKTLRDSRSSSDKVLYVDFTVGATVGGSFTPQFGVRSESISKQAKNLIHSHEGMQNYPSVENSVLSLNQTNPSLLSSPVYFLRPNSLHRSAQWFVKNFHGKVLYSVKSNPDDAVLRYLFDGGISHFDVASLPEIRSITEKFGTSARMYFMHPVKSREAIGEAYHKYGIRDFSLDSVDELKKILSATSHAKDLGLHVRIAIPNMRAAIDLSGKFGVFPTESIPLFRKVRSVAKRFGICFHVGSQCMEPGEYRSALTIVSDLIESAKVKVDVIDIGGGFPSSYPAMTPPPLSVYLNEVHDALGSLPISRSCEFWCEPGRALVAESGSLLVRVEARKKNMLYINDGTYGGLFDAGVPGFIYPTKAIRLKKREPLSLIHQPFGFYGPTCDSMDSMKGPFYLPENVTEGDYIEIGQLGAYSRSIRTGFNGFGESSQFEVSDEPLIESLYDEDIPMSLNNVKKL